MHGVTTSVHLTSDAPCSTCHGSGAKPGTTPQTCGQCHGRGVLDDNQGLWFSQPCVACGGRGKIIKEKCPTCQGVGVERRPRQVAVRVPAGVKDGGKIRLKGRGTPGRNGGPAGDLFVIVVVTPHRIFSRSGNNLTLNVPVTFAEAALGAKVKVPLLDGGSVTLRIPAGTQNGKTFRVTGKGIAGKKATGDLLVSIDVVVPVSLTDDQRAAVEALAATMPDSPRAHLEVTSDGSA
ncbi:MAG: DnaJ C-terminal domain-containing protein [Acidimicrobiales bacterium]